MCSPSDARYQAIQAESLTAALGRTLQRLSTALDGAPASTVEGARMAVDDAARLLDRMRYVRRLVDQLGPEVASEPIPGGIRCGAK